MAYDFKDNAGKAGADDNFIYTVVAWKNGQLGISFEKDVASHNPRTVAVSGAVNVPSDARVNSWRRGHDYVHCAPSQLEAYQKAGSYCANPIASRRPGQVLGIGFVRGHLEKGNDGAWRVDAKSCSKPTVVNLPGFMSNGTRARTLKYSAFEKRLNANHDVTRAQRSFMRDHDGAPTLSAYRKACRAALREAKGAGRIATVTPKMKEDGAAAAAYVERETIDANYDMPRCVDELSL